MRIPVICTSIIHPLRSGDLANQFNIYCHSAQAGNEMYLSTACGIVQFMYSTMTPLLLFPSCCRVASTGSSKLPNYFDFGPNTYEQNTAHLSAHKPPQKLHTSVNFAEICRPLHPCTRKFHKRVILGFYCCIFQGGGCGAFDRADVSGPRPYHPLWSHVHNWPGLPRHCQ